MVIAYEITELIGNTPMLRLNKLPSPRDATVFVKLESLNIGGSIKDRIGKYLIEYAEAAGVLTGDKPILEATSGNTGIALAMVAASKGYPIIITMPESVSVERRKIIRAYGAELILTPKAKGTSGAIEWKHKLLAENPEKYVNLDQFKDPANIMAHYQTTGREIIEQTNGKVDLVAVGVGTGGTGSGVSLRLKHFNKNIKVVGIYPKLGYAIQGLRNPDTPYPTELFREKAFDKIVEFKKKQLPTAYKIARMAARKEGLFIGISSAVILYVALQEAKNLGKGKIVVAILPDSGMKYLSTDLF